MADHNSNQSSPMHLGLTGQFSAEELHELLGAMGDDENQSHLQYAHQAASFAGARNSLQQDSTNNNAAAAAAPRNESSAANHQQQEKSDASSSSAKPGPEIGEDAKLQARSERKRSREKQRRSDVNKQFTDLTQLLQKIEAEDASDEDKKNGSSSSRGLTFNPSNRVDLIARTILLMERLHHSNKKRKKEISSLQQQLEEAKKAGEDTAARLKEAMLAPPGPSYHGQQKVRCSIAFYLAS